MYKFGKDPAYSLTEAPQANPLRWQILFREGDSFEPQTAQFRCKDYLNDIVAKYRGHVVRVYGMDTSDTKLNDDGVWFRLFNIHDVDQFITNVDKAINASVSDAPITLEKLKGSVLMFIPRHFFDSSYKISLASYIIRISNNKVAFDSILSALNSLPAQADRAIKDHGMTLAKTWQFNVPQDYQQYWYYAGPAYNSEKDPKPQGGTIHNNGACSWGAYINANKAIAA